MLLLKIFKIYIFYFTPNMGFQSNQYVKWLIESNICAHVQWRVIEFILLVVKKKLNAQQALHFIVFPKTHFDKFKIYMSNHLRSSIYFTHLIRKIFRMGWSKSNSHLRIHQRYFIQQFTEASTAGLGFIDSLEAWTELCLGGQARVAKILWFWHVSIAVHVLSQ